MYIYLLSTLSLILFAFLPQIFRISLSQILIFTQLAIMGRVGGDYDAYILRGEYALEHPEILIKNEPITVLFSNLSNLTTIPLPSFYFTLIALLTLISIRKSQNKYIYILTYTIFLIPVSIGYLRQGLSIAILLLLLTSQSKISKLLNSIGSLIAHPSAIFPIFIYYLLIIEKKIIKKYWWLIFIILVCTYFYIESALEHYLNNYNLDSSMKSEGYLIRIFLFACIASLLYFGKSKRKECEHIYNKFIGIQFFIIAISLIVFFLNGSTAADRILIYIIPFVLTLYSYQSINTINLLILIITIIYFLGWLVLSPNAIANWNYSTIFN